MKFENYKFEKDNGFDDYDFIKCADIVGKPIVIKKIIHKVKNDGTQFYKAVIFVDNDLRCTVFMGKALVNTIDNIVNEVGWNDDVANTTVYIRTIQSKQGKDTYIFADD